MATKHGNKRYCQLLIDEARYSLLEEQAKRDGKRVTGFMRDLLYECMDLVIDADLVRKAEEIDDAMWERSIKNRVLGRMKNKRAQAA